MPLSKRAKTAALIISLVIIATIAIIFRPAKTSAQQPEATSAQGGPNQVCLSCHEEPGFQTLLPSGETLNLTIDPEVYNASAHGRAVTCNQCHTDIDKFPHPKLTATTRREYVLERYKACADCHEGHYEDEQDSAHQMALEAGNTNAAVCTDCHGAHDIAPPEEPPSRASEMCQQCHSKIYDVYADSVHGAALIGEGNPDVPACTDCHGVHGIRGPHTGPFRLFSPDICADCHADPQLMEKYGLSTEILGTYVADFHGTTVKLFQEVAPGQETNKAVCVDCHGVHNIRATDDPQSTVIRENLLETCQRCHPDATADFPASWLGHYRPDPEHNPVVYFVDIFYLILIPVVLGGMAIFVFTDAGKRIVGRFKGSSPAKKPKKKETEETEGKDEDDQIFRFSISDRIQHWILTLSFGLLAVTGLVQKYPDPGISVWVVESLGGVEGVRIIHRISAVVLMLESIYHLGVLGYKIFVLRVEATMLPGLNDAQAALQWLLYNLGLRKERPKEGRYNFAEKAEYWALIWGTVIMGITGFMLWNPITTSNILPGEVIPAAKVAHGMEAVLATAAILLWHVYHVHIKHWNQSMFTGYLSREAMEEEHPLELEKIESKKKKPAPAPGVLAKRKRRFFVVYGVLAIAMLAAVYFYVSYEDTALETVPPAEREQVPIYAPLTPTPAATPTFVPTPTPGEATSHAEETGIAILFPSVSQGE